MNAKKADVEDASAAMVAAQAALTRAESQLATANAKLAKTQTALDQATAADNAARARLDQARVQLQAGQVAVADARTETTRQRTELSRFVADTYRTGDPQLMQVLTVLQGGTASDISSRLGVIDGVLTKQNSLYEGLKRKVADLAAKEKSLAETAAQVAVEQKATADALQRRQALTQEALTERGNVASLVAARAAAKTNATQIMQRDQAALAQLKAKDDEIQRQILARESQGGNRTHTGSGMLMRPVSGPITSAYGWRVHPIYHYWGLHDGDDFAASCGQPQVAAESGTVVSEYYSDVWGNRLYLDLGKINGHKYTAIYNHTSRYAVRVGQRVARGQVVAYTGTTGWSTGCHLHFTVLKDGNPVDPTPLF